MSKQWIDEKGLEIPASRITAAEKLKERQASRLLREARKLHQQLQEYKIDMADACRQVFAAVMQEAGANATGHKGNFTWYNFDRSIRVEVTQRERLEFDDALIAAAREKLNEFLSTNTAGVDEMIRALIMDAFSTTRGRLDAKKVMGLVRYRARINQQRHPGFHEAVDLIEQSIRRPDTSAYYRVWERKANGEYEAIDLNLSSIKT